MKFNGDDMAGELFVTLDLPMRDIAVAEIEKGIFNEVADRLDNMLDSTDRIWWGPHHITNDIVIGIMQENFWLDKILIDAIFDAIEEATI